MLIRITAPKFRVRRVMPISWQNADPQDRPELSRALTFGTRGASSGFLNRSRSVGLSSARELEAHDRGSESLAARQIHSLTQLPRRG